MSFSAIALKATCAEYGHEVMAAMREVEVPLDFILRQEPFRYLVLWIDNLLSTGK